MLKKDETNWVIIREEGKNNYLPKKVTGLMKRVTSKIITKLVATSPKTYIDYEGVKKTANKELIMRLQKKT